MDDFASFDLVSLFKIYILTEAAALSPHSSWNYQNSGKSAAIEQVFVHLLYTLLSWLS